jgi:hypothetical protein
VHEHDGQAAQALFVVRQQFARAGALVQRLQHLALRAHALVGLDHALYSSSGSTMWRSNSRGRFW